MSSCLRLSVLSFFLGAVGLYFAAGWLAGFGVSGEAALRSLVPPVKPDNAETARKVLTEHCGTCHRSGLPTAKPKALAVFDLDKENWYSSVSGQHLEGISRRISKKGGISDADRAATLEFIECLRQTECQVSENYRK